jgi:hypothetical protein
MIATLWFKVLTAGKPWAELSERLRTLENPPEPRSKSMGRQSIARSHGVVWLWLG